MTYESDGSTGSVSPTW